MLVPIALLSAAIAAADGSKDGPVNDPRIELVHADPGRPIPVRTVAGTDMLIMLPIGEYIQRIVLGRPGDYQVRASAAADSVSLRNLHGSTPTTMEIDTDRQQYEFSLVPTSDVTAPELVRVEPQRVMVSFQAALPKPEDLTPYRVSGAKDLRPQSMSDDGLRTYIKWGQDQLIPAVFAVDPAGQEETVDGYMRDGVFTIDRVYRRLVFRIDRSTVFATRQQKSPRRHGS